MSNKCTVLNCRKTAFTYLELIISMSIIVIITLLTTPFLISMTSSKVNPFGEFICYARYVDGEWKLFQNQRLNTNTYSAEDYEVDNSDRACEFTRPSGNIASFTITIYGGGGSGSAPFFDKADNDCLYVASGENGQAGEEKSITDSLSETFTGDVMQIKLCNDNTIPRDIYGKPTVTCIGVGGSQNEVYGTSFAKSERIDRIIDNIAEDNQSESDYEYLENMDDATLAEAYENYFNDKNASTLDNLLYKLRYCDKDEYGKNTGHSGGATQVLLSNGLLYVADGGKYGISDRYLNNRKYNRTNMVQSDILDENTYYTPANIFPKKQSGKYTNCDGANPNETASIGYYENFGNPGQAGALICNIQTNNFTEMSFDENPEKNIQSNMCYSCSGGMGAGGAIRIQWN